MSSPSIGLGAFAQQNAGFGAALGSFLSSGNYTAPQGLSGGGGGLASLLGRRRRPSNFLMMRKKRKPKSLEEMQMMQGSDESVP